MRPATLLASEANSHISDFETWGASVSQVTDDIGFPECDGASILKCSHCDFTSHDATELVTHQQHAHAVADPGVRYQCHLCESSFVYHRRLLRHLQMHANSNAVRCTYCSKKFSSRKHLSRHVHTMHLSVQVHPCHLCPSKFSRKDNLVAHMRKNHPTLPSDDAVS
ncbi:oocyte zinc finger protein XlCOF28-like [Rhipicephalus sanguineus]|uniref:oocyte zinc finger protein XlCOF28-like n=1 Tax=Rhipicephalus sanguineus TaxID=34632 RepID=UPI0018946A92|nr:oocyte zinc finger protein XlCOF28-like [Rhipicephalus sanguineus]